MSKRFWLGGFLWITTSSLFAQEVQLSLEDLSFFEPNPAKNWQIVGEARANYTEKNQLSTLPGKGVLACIHPLGTYGPEFELISKLQHGDLDISFDFMMAQGSNSGIYLQGRYEIQLMDSWGKTTPKYNDMGGIYERWNDQMPTGQQGYEGYAPRVNVAKAPGIWQHISISFQAPRFDANGKKTQAAKILSITLNGIPIHENVVLSGVTRGALSAQEAAVGPLRFQGDHGSLALRNIQIHSFDKPAGSVSNLSYKTYYGSYPHDEDLSKLTPQKTGKLDAITWEVTDQTNDYAFVIEGNYTAPTTGEYEFKVLGTGNTTLHIDGKEILDNKWTTSQTIRTIKLQLTKGTHTLRLFNNKRDGWLRPSLAFWSAGPGFRETAHHGVSALIAAVPSDPILMEANTPMHLRSFMDLPTNKRVVHAISVGDPNHVHYTYDLDNGSLFQVWRGGFLDATPMWNDRGDGSSKPLGALVYLSHERTIAKQGESRQDTVGTGYRPLGYQLDAQDRPTFQYQIHGQRISDAIRPRDGKGFDRTITASGIGLVAQLAKGKIIEAVTPSSYLIDKMYYVEIPSTVKVQINQQVDSQELTTTVSSTPLTYSILF
jgi:hypothetical protein